MSTKDGEALQRPSSNVDAWIETFEAAYTDVKHQIENLKREIRSTHGRLRVEAITGDPLKAADQAQDFIQWLRGVEQTLKEIAKQPESVQTENKHGKW